MSQSKASVGYKSAGVENRSNDAETGAEAEEVVLQVMEKLSAATAQLGQEMYHALAAGIPELRGDSAIQELLRASSESNVEMFVQLVRLNLRIEEVRPPPAALEYGRRLAQRSISSNALLRAYRLGQQIVQEVAVSEAEQISDDPRVAFLAAQKIQRLAFEYVDRVSEAVVRAYEIERERWLSHRNTVRSVMLKSIVDDDVEDVAVAENALGYRLRQSHLAIVVWDTGQMVGGSQLRTIEHLAVSLAEAIQASGPPLFIPQDKSVAWAWLPLGRTPREIDVETLRDVVADTGGTLRIATGRPDRDLAGFRRSHLEAKQAHRVGSIVGDRGSFCTSFLTPGVETAALLANDIEATRELVQTCLGDLARDDEATERLRETMRIFLKHLGSYVATADEVHLHKNTVKYRVDKALQARGRGLGDDRLGLEVGLLAAQWLGPPVLIPPEQ